MAVAVSSNGLVYCFVMNRVNVYVEKSACRSYLPFDLC
jgi:hypothetical protein